MIRVPLFRVYMADSAATGLAGVVNSGQIADGPRVREFERGLGEYIGTSRIVATSDASGALTLALFLAGVRPADEVIVSPMACTATTMPIANLFARPVWGDVDPATGMLDPGCIAGLVTERTRAVIAYDWSGDMADIDALAEAARPYGLKLIEDASEAFGARRRGVRPGAEPGDGADFTVYSFYATKHITTGEGGALVARSADDWALARWLKRYGIHTPSFRLPSGDLNPASDIPVAGYNFAMNSIAATCGVENLRHADELVGRHMENGLFYEQALQGIPGVHLQARLPASVSGYWTYSFLAERRTDLMRKLRERGIGCQQLHLRNDDYGCFGGRQRELPGVDAFEQSCLSIPCGWWVTPEDREGIAACIREGW